MSHEAKLTDLRERLGTILDLRRAGALLQWDQQTMMPPSGNEGRSDQLSTIDRFAHELFVSEEIGKLLDELAEHEGELDPESIDAALIRVTRRDWDKARQVPPELQEEITRAEVIGVPAWAEARQNSDFQAFLPYLEKNVELKRRYIECFKETGKSDYDVLLDDYQEDASTAEIDVIFERIKEVVIPLIREVAAAEPVETSFAHGHFPVEKQELFGREILEKLGYASEAWRLDPTVHPFATSISIDDIRLTTRYSETDAESIFHTSHEFGHGIYEHGIDPALERTPLVELNSMVLHESQSRLWENLVCRSRPFWRHFFPRLQELFPEQLNGTTDEQWWRYVNRVEPGFIRVDADEVTYGMHIILRYELEQEIIAGRLEPRDVPQAWNEKTKEYLGLDVPDDARGVLQDVHWSGGSFGYFPTYLLGTIASVQIWERLQADLPDLEAQMEAGEFGALREWLGDRMYRWGRRFPPGEMLERIVGGPLDVEPYLAYLKSKVESIYGVRV
ncbi:MAG: carboxypeptidase M32 [Actinomycetota bacterium]|nr:carboxypeptidase M32 [Actinomycetota bacterium]